METHTQQPVRIIRVTEIGYPAQNNSNKEKVVSQADVQDLGRKRAGGSEFVAIVQKSTHNLEDMEKKSDTS